MQIEVQGRTLLLVEGDITAQQVDAIVNAANSRLAGGGGVDGAVHRRGGPEIMEETNRRYPGGCPTGSAVISGAGRLPAKYVIHAVGPVWQGGGAGERELLVSAHRESLRLAAEHDCASIAFPALSTGAYRYPLGLAAAAALETAVDCLTLNDTPQHVRFVLFGPEALDAFATALKTLREL